MTGAASTGFTITYTGLSPGVDVPNIELVSLSCGGCFASVEETNHGGAIDSFRLNYNGSLSAPIVNGVNYTAAGIEAALTPILPAGGTVTIAGFGGGGVNNTGFQVTYAGTLAAANNPVMLGVEDFTPGASGFVGETDKGGAVDNGGIVTPTGNTFPTVTVPAGFTIPLRTPFALTGSATDVEGDTLVYSWEQNDRGGNAAGTSLLNNIKTNGPLFAMFPKSAQISETDTLLYNSPGENHLTTSPTRVFPDLQQILDNNTNADTGSCAPGPIAPPVPIPVTECFSEFLPTSDYVGFAGINAGPPPTLHFRFTARDLRVGGGGNNAADLTLTLAPTTGPFLVTAPNSAVTYPGGSTQTVTWDVADTNLPPVSTTDVKISLSTDGGLTYPIVLAASTANDGSEARDDPERGDRRRPREGRGDRQRLLRRLERQLHDHRHGQADDHGDRRAARERGGLAQHQSDDHADGHRRRGRLRDQEHHVLGHRRPDDPVDDGERRHDECRHQHRRHDDVELLRDRQRGQHERCRQRHDQARQDRAGGVPPLRPGDAGRRAVRPRRPLGHGGRRVAPSRVQRVITGDRNLRVEIRTYDLADAAGNTLQLIDSVGLTSTDVAAGIQTLQYKGGAVTRPAYSLISAQWKLKKNAIDELKQTFVVTFPSQTANAGWTAKSNQTKLTTTVGGTQVTTTVAGMLLPRLATNNGALAVETTP